jgi:mannan endo-1,4-beta-mannosidase
MFRDKAMWSFFGLWYGDYIMNSNGNFSSVYNSEENIKKTYNSEGTINLYKYVNRNKTAS